MVIATLAILLPSIAFPQTIVVAHYADPTTRYDHGVLGDAIEHGTLELTLQDGKTVRFVLPQSLVFEDTAPRLADVTGDGLVEVVVVESSQTKGARLAVYNADARIAQTPFIGQRNRWLAPVGVADLDGDGHIEIAYVDRPHLAKTLRVWRYRAGALSEVASLSGVTNHRIGERDIAGGIRTCAGLPEIIVARADWRRLLAVRFDGRTLAGRDIGPHMSRDSFSRALSCD